MLQTNVKILMCCRIFKMVVKMAATVSRLSNYLIGFCECIAYCVTYQIVDNNVWNLNKDDCHLQNYYKLPKFKIAVKITAKVAKITS